ncbi:MAG: polysaccharide biosynthesis/export family protein [Gammaproteobacteria bacterium]|nr:polysaccharide biosynthesis/export family protein [Gammaproteobacteria bacterium]
MNETQLHRLGVLAVLACLGFANSHAQGAGGNSGEPEYRLAAGDQLKITVYGHEDLSGEFEVDGAGDVSMPLINEVSAEGRTADELEVEIVAALKPDYLKNPRVSVEVLNYRPFYIIGEVTSPGSYPYVSGMTVVNAVAVAGGFTYRARKGRIKIVREQGERKIELQAEMNTEVQPGDVIEIPERFF